MCRTRILSLQEQYTFWLFLAKYYRNITKAFRIRATRSDERCTRPTANEKPAFAGISFADHFELEPWSVKPCKVILVSDLVDFDPLRATLEEQQNLLLENALLQ